MLVYCHANLIKNCVYLRMIISLTGFMGSGKTTVGHIVADALGCPFFDLDDIVVKKAGKDIPAIFVEDGELAFRVLEADCLKSFIKKYAQSTTVLALGGGTLQNASSAKLIKEKTFCIYLQASTEALKQRLSNSTGRPLAYGDWQQLLEKRLATYESTAVITLDTDGLSPEQIADEIIIDCL